MSKYEPMYQFLSGKCEGHLSMSFAEIEQVLGFNLPASARRYNAWWANQSGEGHSQTTCWQEAGWKTSKVDMAAERVTFSRLVAPDHNGEGVALDAIPQEIWSAAEALTGLSDRAAIVRQAMQQLLAHAAAQQLSKLGGTDKTASAPDRARVMQ